jgi:archaemetzincin
MSLIRIVSLGNVNKDMMQMIARYVRGMFGCGVETQEFACIDDLDFAYDKKKGQYNSAIILRDLALRCDSTAEKFLAITEVDLFIPMLTFVYGQAQLSGKLAMVSLARLRPEFYGLLSDKDLTVRRIRKEVAHELGHTFGLVHCTDKSCLMSLSTEIMQVDLKSENFCRSCWISLGESLKIMGNGNNGLPLSLSDQEQKQGFESEQGDL